jgi:hypothetical protein
VDDGNPRPYCQLLLMALHIQIPGLDPTVPPCSMHLIASMLRGSVIDHIRGTTSHH